MNLPRGIRNNNPGNIKKSSTDWEGKVSGNDPTFEVFSSHILGIRALIKILNTYKSKYGLNTVEEILYRWAPPNENNTPAYIKYVCSVIGKGPDDTLEESDTLNLVKAIITMENGEQPYTDEDIEEAIRRSK